jgi:hypothetical protein
MKALNDLPPGVAECLDLVEGLDDGLVHGFARLGDDQRRSLEAVAGVFAGSPLAPAMAEAVEAIERSEFMPRAFLALASARLAMLGAVHDALVAQAREALGRPAMPRTEQPARPTGPYSSAMASVQRWLMELAIAGFRQLEETTVSPFAATLENLQEHEELTGLAALLTGFYRELLRSLPTSRMPGIPSFRWADLWSAAFGRTQGLPAAAGFRPVKGSFVPLGLDVQSHENFVRASLYGLFEDKQATTVRIPFGAFKVGVIAGPEVWDLFGDSAEPVLSALAEHRMLRISGAELREDGDLVLRSPPDLGEPSHPFDYVGRLTAMPDPPAIARHPVHIAEVVPLASGHGLPMAVERLSSDSPITADAVAAADEQIALLRFDRGGWRFQPLCLRNKGRFVLAGEELAAARRKLKRRSVDVLKERASRLLRKS